MFRNRSPLFEEAPADTGTGGGGGEPAAFDPEAFKVALKTELLGEFNKTLNGFSKTFKADVVKLIPKAPEPLPPPEIHVDPKVDPALNSQLQKLQLQVTNLTKQGEERETALQGERTSRLETERQSAIKTALADIPFKDDASRSLFFKGIQGDIKRDEDGNLVADTANGPITYSDYIKGQADLLPSLLLPKGNGGAGAGAGTKRTGSGFNPLDDVHLTPAGMAKLTSEQKAEVTKSVFSQIA